MRRFHVLSFACPLLLAACSGTSGPEHLDIPAQCNPLRGDDPLDCMTPFPSSVYEVANAATATGVQVSVPASAMPQNTSGTAVGPRRFDAEDGFSPIGPIVVHFKEGVKPDNLPPWKDLAQSLSPSSPTQILDLQGHRQLQFSEVDVTATDPSRAALLVRPMTRLLADTTYVVVLTKSLVDASGAPLPVPAGMQALLDGTPTDSTALERIRPDFETKVRPALAAAGIDESNVLLAWDFTTASDTYLTSHLTEMRDQALAAVGDGSKIAYTITSLEPGYGGDGTLYARIMGTYQVPLFLASAKENAAMPVDANGAPVVKMNGTYAVPFVVLVPSQAATSTAPLPVVLFGHGLLGNATDTSADSRLRQIAQKNGAILAFTNFTGLSTPDITQVGVAMTDINQLPSITDKLQQAIVNFIVLLRFVRGSLAQDPMMQPMHANIVSPDVAYYAGGSLGGILGDTFMAYDPDITQAVLNVPGGDWSLMMQRSFAWPALGGLLENAYPDGIDEAVLLAYAQSQFDYSDPITTAPYVLGGMKPLTVPPKHFLMQEGRNDMYVTNLATEATARTLGIPLLLPTDDTPYGLTATKGPLVSGLTIYDLEPMLLPNVTDAPNTKDNGVHTHVYQQPAAMRQIEDYLQPGGMVIQECSGSTGCICGAPQNACM